MIEFCVVRKNKYIDLIYVIQYLQMLCGETIILNKVMEPRMRLNLSQMQLNANSIPNF